MKLLTRFIDKIAGDTPEDNKSSSRISENPKDNDDRFAYYSDACRQEIQSGNFGKYRNLRYNMAEVCFKEKKYLTALKLYCEVCYWDMSGLSNGEGFWFRSNNHAISERVYSLSAMKRRLNYSTWEQFCAPACRKRILQIKNRLIDDDITERIYSFMSEFSAPFHPFNNDDCAELLLCILRDEPKLPRRIITCGIRKIDATILYLDTTGLR